MLQPLSHPGSTSVATGSNGRDLRGCRPAGAACNHRNACTRSHARLRLRTRAGQVGVVAGGGAGRARAAPAQAHDAVANELVDLQLLRLARLVRHAAHVVVDLRRPAHGRCGGPASCSVPCGRLSGAATSLPACAPCCTRRHDSCGAGDGRVRAACTPMPAGAGRRRCAATARARRGATTPGEGGRTSVMRAGHQVSSCGQKSSTGCSRSCPAHLRSSRHSSRRSMPLPAVSSALSAAAAAEPGRGKPSAGLERLYVSLVARAWPALTCARRGRFNRPRRGRFGRPARRSGNCLCGVRGWAPSCPGQHGLHGT
jgi:hypothetical protein